MELSIILLTLAIIFSILGIIADFLEFDDLSSFFTLMGLLFCLSNMLITI